MSRYSQEIRRSKFEKWGPPRRQAVIEDPATGTQVTIWEYDRHEVTFRDGNVQRIEDLDASRRTGPPVIIRPDSATRRDGG